MKRIAVVGAHGMLGQEVCGQCQELRPEVSLSSLDLPALDITDPASVASCRALQQADTIINCAGYTQVDNAEAEEDQAFRVNRDGAGHLARAAAGSGAHLIHVSTDYVFDGLRSKPKPYLPEEVASPLSVYGRSKLSGEKTVQESGCAFTIVRSAWLYGAGERHFVATVFRQAREQGELHVVCDQVGSPTWTRDLTQALLGFADTRITGIFHAVNTGAASWHQFACEVVKQTGLVVPVLPITSAEAAERFCLKAERPRCSVLDMSSAEEALGYSMRPWQEALGEYISCAGL